MADSFYGKATLDIPIISFFAITVTKKTCGEMCFIAVATVYHTITYSRYID